MKKLVILIVIFSFTLISFGQSADKGRIKMDVGTGFSLMRTVSNENLKEKGFALPTHTFFTASYNTHDRVSIGLEYYTQNYRTDDSTVNTIRGNSLGINLQYYFMNRPKSNAYLGTSVGGFNISYSGYFYPDSNSADTVTKDLFFGAKGVYNTLYLGYNLYITKIMGFYVKAGLTNYPARMDWVELDGQNIQQFHNIPIDDWRMLMRGGFISIGLTFKFRNGKEETVPKEKVDE